METIKEYIREFLPIIIAAIPGILALISQRMKERAESKTTKADAADRLSEATTKIQDIYQDLINDLTEQMDTCKSKLDQVLCEIDKIKIVNENLIKTNQELSISVEDQRERIRELENKVTLLIQQVKSLGETPVVTLDNDKEKE